VNARNHNLQTLMHVLAGMDHLNMVKPLLECGANVHTEDSRGELPYQLLLRRGHREMADYIWRYGTGRERFDDFLL